MRKMHLAMRANALIVFPGGFGTMDELFEILTLRQTMKAPPIPIILFDEPFWRSIIDFEAMRKHQVIAQEDLSIFQFAESAEQIWRCLLDSGLKSSAAIEPKPRA